jgi:predicted permease
VLSVAVLRVFLPALAFGLVVSAPLDRTFTAVPLSAALVVIASLAAGFAAYTLLPWFRDIPRPAFGVMLLSAGFGNVMYLGLPVITETLGAQHGYVAVLYDLLASTPNLLTIGVFIAAQYGNGRAVSIKASPGAVHSCLRSGGCRLAVHVRRRQRPVLDATGLMAAVVPIMTFTQAGSTSGT